MSRPYRVPHICDKCEVIWPAVPGEGICWVCKAPGRQLTWRMSTDSHRDRPAGREGQNDGERPAPTG